VVYRGDGAVGAADLAVGETQAVECLGRGDLVDELEIDVEERRLACGFGDEVLLPDFFEEGAGGCGWCRHKFPVVNRSMLYVVSSLLQRIEVRASMPLTQWWWGDAEG